MSRILSVVWYKVLPPLFGGQKGIAEFNEHLANHHSLTCLCASHNEPEYASYTTIPTLPQTRLQVISPIAWKQLFDAIRTYEITHLLLEHCYYGLAGIFFKKWLGVKLVVHAHNIESLRFRQEGRWWWPFLWFLENITLRQADLVMFKTQRDQKFATTNWGVRIENTMIVPFGLNRNDVPTVAEKESARKSIQTRHQFRDEEKILLFAGTLDYEPNALALTGIVQKLIPLLSEMNGKKFRVLVCGRLMNPAYQYLKKLEHEDYTFAGLVQDIEQYMLAADVFINPVVEGGGIKVKTIEALAYNLPVVSFEQGAEGIDMEVTGTKLHICEDGNWKQFAHKVCEATEPVEDIPLQFFSTYQWISIVEQAALRIGSL
jgi:glycosyltransferase involved in cell wall biosynthesis